MTEQTQSPVRQLQEIPDSSGFLGTNVELLGNEQEFPMAIKEPMVIAENGTNFNNRWITDSLGFINELKNRVAHLMEVSSDDLYWFWSVESYLIVDTEGSMRFIDRTIRKEGLTTDSGFIYRDPKISTKLNGFGIRIFETDTDPVISYAMASIPSGDQLSGSLRFRPCFIKKGEAFRLIRYWQRKRILSIHQEKPTLPDGMIEKIEKNSVQLLLAKRKLAKYGVQARRGIVFSGSPGNGKTMACRYIKTLCNYNQIEHRTVTWSSLMNAFEKDYLEDIFNEKGIVFFDDINVSIFNRQNDKHAELACAILAAMDGINNRTDTIRIFTTNEQLNEMDPAFKRPGRIDKVFFFESPGESLRRDYLATWPEKIKDTFDIERAKKLTEGMSYAEIKSIKDMMVVDHIVNDKPFDFDRVLGEVKKSLEEKNNGPLGKSRIGLKGGLDCL